MDKYEDPMAAFLRQQAERTWDKTLEREHRREER